MTEPEQKGERQTKGRNQAMEWKSCKKGKVRQGGEIA